MSQIKLVLLIVLLARVLYSKDIFTKDESLYKSMQATRWNEKLLVDRLVKTPGERFPVADFYKFKYVLMNYSFGFNSRIKQLIAANLPEDVKLVVLTVPGSEANIIENFSKWISSERLIVVSHQDATNGFWARDSFPIPAFSKDTERVELISHKYYREFNGNQSIASQFSRDANQNDYFYVGGNFIADEMGNCFVIESRRLYGLKDKVLISNYGCVKVHRFKHIDGIGDVDEVIKPLPNGQVLTNQRSYVKKLQSLGYQVTILPKLENYRTYANSLLVNGVAFMPSYDIAEDDVAAKIYESFGYKVVKVPAEEISTEGRGAIHCITMAYPDMDLNRLLQALK